MVSNSRVIVYVWNKVAMHDSTWTCPFLAWTSVLKQPEREGHIMRGRERKAWVGAHHEGRGERNT